MKRILTIIILLTLPVFLYAESEFEKWQKEQKSEYQEEKKEYSSYIKKQDKEFSNYLKKEWQDFKAHKEIIKDSTPKPKKPPTLPEEEKDIDRKIKEEKTPEKTLPEKPEKPEKPKKEPDDISLAHKKEDTVKKEPSFVCKMDSVKLNFYGNDIALCLDENIKKVSIDKISNKEIASFWEKMSSTNYENTLKQIGIEKERLSLNDWGYHMLLYKLGMKLFENDTNVAKLFMWFYSSKSDFLTKASYSDDKVIILFAYDYELYGVKYLKFNEQKFYALNFSDEKNQFSSLKTYENNYSKKNKTIKLSLTKYPDFINKALKKRKITFQYDGKTYNTEFACNKEVVDYFKLYPQTEFEIYFNAKMRKALEANLLEPIKSLIKDKSQKDAVKILLRLTQKAFEYKTDDDQFGYEKYLLPEEVIFYPFSDCEDRSFFFAFLVKELLNMKVIGLHYPGHIATAVLFKEKIEGDSVNYENKKYIVCDPTYINADIGMAMPKFKEVKPKIIRVN